MISSTVFSFLEMSAASFPNKAALVFRGKKITYKKFLIASQKVAAFFISHRKNAGSIGLFMENSPDWLITYFGIVASGTTCVPLSLHSSDENLISQILLADIRFVIVAKKFIFRWKNLLKQFKNPPALITPDKILVPAGKITKLKLRPVKFPIVLFTSGATSFQKAIRLSQNAVSAATRNIIDYLKPDYDDIYYAQLPFYHSFGLGNVHITLATGGTVIISDAGINLKKVLQDIAKYRVTFWAATPYTLEIAVRHFFKDLTQAGEYLRKICTNTGPMLPAITKTIIEKLPKVQFFTYYGLTEASRSSFLHYNLYPDKLGSVGKPAPNVSICIVGRKNKSLPPRQIGEIYIKGPHVVDKYWKNPLLTREHFHDGWFHTGDMGYFDEDDFLYIAGRKDDMVDIGGEKFSLGEVDKVLLSCKNIRDAASFLVSSSRMNFIAGCIVPASGFTSAHAKDILKKEVLEACKKRLDRHQIPTKIIFTDSIPRTDNGKIKRNFFKKTYAR